MGREQQGIIKVLVQIGDNIKYTFSPETFEVTELFNPQVKKEGKYAYCILEKKGISHKQAQKRLPKDACFCGVKDKNASTQQWFSTKNFIEEINEPDFKVSIKGFCDDRIHIGMHKGNIFRIKVELSEMEQRALQRFKPKKELVCNYFGEQRFDRRTDKFYSLLNENNYEETLKLFLTEKSEYDTEKSSSIKKVVLDNWGNWEKILQSEEVKGTGKQELFEFLLKETQKQGHTAEFDKEVFRKAFSLAEPKSLKQMLKSCQSIRFNSKLNELSKNKKPKNIETQIAGQILNINASKAFLKWLSLEATAFEKEHKCGGFERRTFFSADKFKAKRIGHSKTDFELSFELGRGEYATVYLKFLEEWLKKTSGVSNTTKQSA